MPLFRKKNSLPAAPPSGPRPRRGSARRPDEDWRAFDSVAEAYSRVFAPHLELVANDLVALLEVHPGQRVLDVGTGTGAGARAAVRAAGPDGVVVGIDPSLGMLRAAVDHEAAFAAATSIDLPFRDATFDHAMANFVIAFFPDYRTAMFDVLRVLRPGGRLAVSAWGLGDDQDELRRTWRGVAEEFAEHEILEDALARAVPWEARFSDRAALKATLHDAGLRDIWTETRQYRFESSREDWLTGREIASLGRFLRQMLGEELWEVFRRRSRQVFADRFPERLNDLRDVNVAVGHKP